MSHLDVYFMYMKSTQVPIIEKIFPKKSNKLDYQIDFGDSEKNIKLLLLLEEKLTV